MTALNLVTVRNSLPADQRSDDNAALAACMADPSPTLDIFLPEGQGTNRDGSYNISVSPFIDPSVPNPVPSRGNVTRSNVRIYGQGKSRTILRQKRDPDEPVFMVHVDDPLNPSVVPTNIQIDNMSIVGNSSSDTGDYNQQNNLIFIGGVNGLTIQLVEFRDFEGDGLYMGSPRQRPQPENSNLRVIDCNFDGVNKRNRDGISILDCRTWSVTGCSFYNCSDVTRVSPGAIDIEPEDPRSEVTNGTIRNCSFSNVGGHAVSILNGVGAKVSGLDFSYCNVQNMDKGLLVIEIGDKVTAANLYVDGIFGELMLIRNSETVTVRDNTFRNAGVIRLGGRAYPGIPSTEARIVTIQNNAFYRCGLRLGPVIAQDGNINDVKVLGNNLIECGVPGATSPLYFVQNSQANDARVARLTVTGNTVQSAGSNINAIGAIAGNRIEDRPGPTYYSVDKSGNTPENYGAGDNLISVGPNG